MSQDKHSGQNITLRPLEIISFRVNLEQKIVFKNHPSNLANQLALQKRNSDIVQSLDNVVALTNLRKRCFWFYPFVMFIYATLFNLFVDLWKLNNLLLIW